MFKSTTFSLHLPSRSKSQRPKILTSNVLELKCLQFHQHSIKIKYRLIFCDANKCYVLLNQPHQYCLFAPLFLHQTFQASLEKRFETLKTEHQRLKTQKQQDILPMTKVRSTDVVRSAEQRKVPLCKWAGKFKQDNTSMTKMRLPNDVKSRKL